MEFGEQGEPIFSVRPLTNLSAQMFQVPHSSCIVRDLSPIVDRISFSLQSYDSGSHVRSCHLILSGHTLIWFR